MLALQKKTYHACMMNLRRKIVFLKRNLKNQNKMWPDENIMLAIWPAVLCQFPTPGLENRYHLKYFLLVIFNQ